MDLIIDGYNLIGSERGLSGSLEYQRKWLVQQLSQYQKFKQFNLVVVFDGWRSGQVKEVAEKRDGILVVYSRLGEKADAVIIRIARQKGDGCVVVSSDREICRAVERFGAVALGAADFTAILDSLDGVHGTDESDEEEFGTRNRGNPHRLSKSERRRLDKLRKLRL
ncbi:MAG TPA: NYN domain-containing protein [Acidobacteriota bacterium]|nr:NYN domain-containing protein [Acidobacteriota bacterium]